MTNRREFLRMSAIGAAGVAMPAIARGGDAEAPSSRNAYYSTLPVLGEFDVAVMGAGPGGIGAALAAARKGMKVALVEKYGFAGGNAAYGCTPLFFLFEHRGPKGWSAPAKDWKQIIRGIPDEIVRRLDRRGAAFPMKDGDCRVPIMERVGDRELLGKIMFKPEHLKVLVNEMLEEAGVARLFYTHIADAMTDGRRVTGAVVSCLEGLRTLKAKVFIDATGEATFAALAGAATEKPDPMATMHKSAFMFLGGLAKGAVETYIGMYRKLLKEGKFLKNVWADPGWTYLLNEGEMLMPITYAVGDSSSSADMTRMDAELRKANIEILEILRKEIPGFENAHCIQESIQVGSRDGRHMVGRMKLDIDFLDHGEVPKDGTVPIWRWWGGEHSPDQSKGFGTPTRGYRPTLTKVPYRSLVARDFDNLLAAGRGIWCDNYSVTTIRMMPTCMAIGEAAGNAAAAAITKSLADVGDVEVVG